MAIIERDVIVIGAGPAGAICAAYMARSGLDVLLLDKEIFPRDKVSGDTVREGVLRHLETLEAVEALDEISTCVRRAKIISGGGNEAVVPFECYTLPRYRMDKLLTDTAVSWGVEFRQGTRVTDIIEEDGGIDGVIVADKDTVREYRAPLVIGADGVNSDFLKMIGVDEERSSGVWIGQRAYFKGVKLDKALAKDQYNAYGIFAFDGNPGPAYFWIMPVGVDGVKNGICNVGMVAKGRDRHKFSELTDRMERIMKENDTIKEMLNDAEQLSQWSFGKISDGTQNRMPAGDGFMLIGDAASRVAPFFGDGLTAAAETAKAAADAADAAFDHGDFSEEFLLSKYEESIRKQRNVDDENFKTKQKSDRLLMESMEDPEVFNMMVERLARDPSYRNKIR